MSRTSPSDRSARRVAALLTALAVVAGCASVAAAEELCDEPIATPRQYAQLAPSREPGASRSRIEPRLGPIVTLPLGAAPPVAQQAPGEVLLAVPKRPDGTLGGGFELASGARVVDSFWSPVLCATIARVVGDPSAGPDDLFTKRPEDLPVAPNHVYTTAATTVAPVADPYRKLQHSLDRLAVEAAWPVSSGTGARVAVLDSAPESDHPDLDGVRVVPLPDGPGVSAAVHGSLTAGVIAGVPGNGFGIAGVAPEAEVIAIPVCTPLGATAQDTCALFDLLKGVDVAIDERAQVVNLSIVGPPNPLLERAMARLDALGVVVVAAAGNEGTDAPRYPAACPSVVGVGAANPDGRPDASSNRGLSAELWAPGTDVISTVPGGAFAYANGTSIAAAHVSASLAVLIGSGAKPGAARRALFHAAQAASADADAPAIAPLCDALSRVGRGCPPVVTAE